MICKSKSTCYIIIKVEVGKSASSVKENIYIELWIYLIYPFSNYYAFQHQNQRQWDNTTKKNNEERKSCKERKKMVKNIVIKEIKKKFQKF